MAKAVAGKHSQGPPSTSGSKKVGELETKAVLTLSPGLLVGPSGALSWQVGKGRIINLCKHPSAPPAVGRTSLHESACGLDQHPEFSAWCYDTISCSLVVSGSEHHSVYTQQYAAL